MSFDFGSMPTKFLNLTGRTWNYSGNNDINGLARLTTEVVVNIPIADVAFLSIRDWCQDNFGDDWIYNWNEFYFKHKEDALLFRLRYP